MNGLKGKVHVMLDLETASTSSNAAILQIGAVTSTGELFEATCSFVSNALYKRDFESGTVDWWNTQDASLREKVWGGTASLKTVLYEFTSSLSSDVLIWGNGSMFDCTILENALKATGIKAPWSFRNYMCFRTLTTMYAKEWENYKKTTLRELKHDALADAIYQMGFLRQLLGEE